MKQLMNAFALAALLALIPTAHAADAPKDFKVGEFAFKTPPGWDWVPTTSSKRKAQLRFSSGQTAQAEVIFFHFGKGDGGGGVYSVSGTIGQAGAGGPMTGGQSSLVGGFWALPVAVQSSNAPTLYITNAAPGFATTGTPTAWRWRPSRG